MCKEKEEEMEVSTNRAGNLNTTSNTTNFITTNFELGPVVLTTSSTIATLICLFFTAAYFSTRPSPTLSLLQPSTLKKLAHVSTTCFLPSLMFVNLAKSLDINALSSLWILPVIAILHIQSKHFVFHAVTQKNGRGVE